MPLSLDSIFKNKEPEKILKSNIYDYRERCGDDEFHFLVGAAMLQLGFLGEAFLAFSKAISLKGSAELKSRLFLCITLMNAERYKECANELLKIEWTRLDASQLYVFMDLAERAGIDPEHYVLYFEAKYQNSRNMKDKVVYALRAVKYRPEEAAKRLPNMSPWEFAEAEDYFAFLDECHTAGTPSREIMNLLAKIPITSIILRPMIRTMVSTRVFLEMTKKERDKWRGKALAVLQEEEKELKSRVWSALYEAEEYYDNKARMEKGIKILLDLYDKGAREETAMMTIAAHFLKNFSNENVGKAQEILADLTKKDPENMLFRKYLHELMMKTGRLAEAEKLNIDSLNLRARKEKEINDLLDAFHRFYGNRKCPLEADGDICPLCFGTGDVPQFKVVCANVSPRAIYTKKMSTHTISIKDEETMAKIFDWQPTHVASPIIGEYLRSLGTYPSKRGFPDVLVEGETYVFIRYKKDALKRLISEGYSLHQIDPMFSILYPNAKPKELESAQEEDRRGGVDGAVTAEDFVIEIVRAIA